MRVGVLNKSSEKFNDLKNAVCLLNSKEIINEGDLKDIDALLIFKHQAFGIVEVCEWVIKAKIHQSIPVWIATSEKQVEEKNIYFQLGVCGVFEAHYTIEEIDLLISNNLRSMKSDDWVKKNEELSFQLDPLKLSLSVGNTTVSLTKLEYFLITLLYENKEEVCTYEMLVESLLGGKVELAGEIGQGRVANIICKIRAKLAQVNDGKPELIKTIRSKGYMLTLSV